MHREGAREALQRVGLLDRQDTLASNLSFGQQKRLMIARALAMQSDLWLLDEPAAGLDVSHVREMMELVRGLADLGKTVCLVEHNIGVVRHVSDRVLFMSEGALLAQGSPTRSSATPSSERSTSGTRRARSWNRCSR